MLMFMGVDSVFLNVFGKMTETTLEIMSAVLLSGDLKKVALRASCMLLYTMMTTDAEPEG